VETVGRVSDEAAAAGDASVACGRLGSRAILQIGQVPAVDAVTSGCIGQAYDFWLATLPVVSWCTHTKPNTTAAAATVARRILPATIDAKVAVR
jgi:hypothetical protein